MAKTQQHANQRRRGVRFWPGQDREPTTGEMREREVLRITRRIAALERKRKSLNKAVKDISKELKTLRRALKIVLAPVFGPADIEFDSSDPRTAHLLVAESPLSSANPTPIRTAAERRKRETKPIPESWKVK